MVKTLQTRDREAFGRWVLGDIIDWISDNLRPDDIWDNDKLVDFFVTHADQELYDDLLCYIRDSEVPESVFDEKDLVTWAEENL